MHSLNHNHVHAQLWIHAIISTKKHEPLLTRQCDLKLYKLFSVLLKRKRCPATAINGSADHVHLLFYLHPSINLDLLMIHLAKESTRFVDRAGLLPHPLTWDPGYHAYPIHPRELSLFAAYLSQQKELHRYQSLHDELIGLTRKPDS